MSEEENEDEIVGGGERERREHRRTLLAVLGWRRRGRFPAADTSTLHTLQGTMMLG